MVVSVSVERPSRPAVSGRSSVTGVLWMEDSVDDRKTEGGHDAKGAASREKSSAGKAVGYSDADAADTVTGKDGLRKPGAKPDAPPA